LADDVWDAWQWWLANGYDDNPVGLLTAVRVWCGDSRTFASVLGEIRRRSETLWEERYRTVRAHLASPDMDEQARLDVFVAYAELFGVPGPAREALYGDIISGLPPAFLARRCHAT
jgi:hypothetical protein